MNGPVNGAMPQRLPTLPGGQYFHSRPMSPVGFMARISTIGAQASRTLGKERLAEVVGEAHQHAADRGAGERAHAPMITTANAIGSTSKSRPG